MLKIGSHVSMSGGLLGAAKEAYSTVQIPL